MTEFDHHVTLPALRLSTMAVGETLTTKRIGRVLRRVRVSCQALQQYHAKPHRPKATYTPSIWTASMDAPLAVIPPPGALTSRLIFRDGDDSQAELSPRIYAVRDAFRDLVINTSPGDGSQTHASTSMAALCAIVVGGNMERSEESKDESASSNEEREDDDATLLYDAVPLQYRWYVDHFALVDSCMHQSLILRWTLLSHATSIVLNVCPPYPTLYRILLETAISYNLSYESEVFLKALLDLSFLSSNQDPYICHPMHSQFLLDLRTLWLSRPLSTQSSFLRVLQAALAEASSCSVWNSRALDLLLQSMMKRSLDAFFDLSHPFMEQLARAKDPNVSRQMGTKCAMWISGHVLAHTEQEVVHCSDLVRHFHHLGIHKMPSHQSLTDSLTCVSTMILGPRSPEPILLFLRTVEPHPTTYNTLVTHIFQTSVDTFDEKTRFAKLASSLSDTGLLRLEASLWRCILDRLEHQHAHDRDELRDYQEELTDLLEDAEQRCFSSAPDDKKYHWDPIGCWVRSEETPRPRKRQKRAYEEPRIFPKSPFVSLLRRAAFKRVVLHPASPDSRERSLSSSPPRRRFADPSLSSEDALDMFTYRHSP